MTTTRRIVPAEADGKMMLAGQKSIEASVIGALRGEHRIAEGDLYRAMLAASPASGKVTKAEVEKAARALYECDQAGLAEAESIGMKLAPGAITPWENLHQENRAGYLRRARAALASLGLSIATTGKE